LEYWNIGIDGMMQYWKGWKLRISSNGKKEYQQRIQKIACLAGFNFALRPGRQNIFNNAISL
jgi:hypothetical protein